MCICCRENPTFGGRPYCPPCTLAVRDEVERGLTRLGDYLRAWAEFQAWCADRRVAA